MRTDDACRRHAPILAALEEYTQVGLDPQAVDAARAHLASCARCQSLHRTWARLDEALRATLASDASAMGATTADVLAAIGADHEPRERRTPLLSVVMVRDMEEMDSMDGMDSDEGLDRESAGTVSVLDGSSGQRRRVPRWRRAMAGLVAVAVAVALVVGALGALNLSGQLRGANRPNATAVVASATAGARIVSLSMDSATDGWALEVNADVGVVNVLHLVNGVASVAITLDDPGADQSVVQAFSPTDVWVMLPNSVFSFYHYDGRVWAPTPLAVPSGVDGSTLNVTAFSMRSPTDGWAAGTYQVIQTQGGMSFNISKLAFYHYDGTAWTLDPTSASLTGDYYTVSGNAVFGNGVVITGVSATLPGDAWAVGFASSAPEAGVAAPDVGYLYERAGSGWRLASTLPNTRPTGIAMTGDASGWLLGLSQRTMPSVTAPGQSVVHATPVAYAWDGARWTQVALPPISPYQWTDSSAQLALASPSNVWALAPSFATQVQPGETTASDATYLARYDGQNWALAALPRVPVANLRLGANASNVAIFNRLAAAPNGDLWLAGLLLSPGSNSQVYPLLYRYANGQWTAIAVPRV